MARVVVVVVVVVVVAAAAAAVFFAGSPSMRASVASREGRTAQGKDRKGDVDHFEYDLS